MATVQKFMTAGGLALALIFSIGCQTTPPIQLTVKTEVWVQDSCPQYPCTPSYLPVPFPGIKVWGNYVEPEVLGPGPSGTLSSYTGTTNSSSSNGPAIYQSQNLLLPAMWNNWVQFPSPMCSSASTSQTITYTNVGYG